MGPENGPISGALFFGKFCAGEPPSCAQVAAFFQWCQWLRFRVLGDEAYTVANLDETAISRGMAPRRSHCVGALAAVGRQRYARISLREARGHLTYVAAIADDPDVHRR